MNKDKHKGIQGTPWHKEYLKKDEFDPKRHKARCYYYERKYKDKESYCRLLGTRCGSSSFCENYKEVDKSSLKNEKSTNETNISKRQTSVNKYKVHISDEEGEKKFPIGSVVIHKSFGFGEVKEISKGNITFDFDDFGIKTFNLQAVINNKLVSRVNKVNKTFKYEIIDVYVIGEYEGDYKLIVYGDKLKQFSHDKLINGYIPRLIKDGKVKQIPISIDLTNNTIYIHKTSFDKHREYLGNNSFNILKSK